MDPTTREGMVTPAPINVSTREAAALLGVSAHTLNNWRGEGRGPRYVKYGTRVLYPYEGLVAYNEAHAVDPEGVR